MDWSAVGALAELAGAIGVIATLGYLAAQVRHNTQAVRVQTYDSFVSQFRDWNAPMRADENTALRWLEMIERFESLDPKARGHAVHVLYDFIRLAENLHYQREQGLIEDLLWEGWENLFRAYLNSPAFHWYWERRRTFFSRDFGAWVDRLQADPDLAAPTATRMVEG